MRPSLPAVLAALCLAPSLLASDLTLDGRSAVRKFMGAPLEVAISGSPGLPVSLIVDVEPGPVIVNGVTVPVGLSDVWELIPFGVIPPGGTLDTIVVLPQDPLAHELTIHMAAVVFDPGLPSGIDVSAGARLTLVDRNLPLAGHSLAGYPWFEHVRAVNQGSSVELGLEPSRVPELAGRTADVYVVAARSRDEWLADRTLVDVGTGPITHTFSGASLAADVLTLDTGTLSGEAGIGLGVGYDVVVDFDQDGLFDDDDLADGFSDEAGFYVVHDVSKNGPLDVTEILYSGGSFLGQNTFYPTDIASMGELPLVVVSHGNGHNYQWYDHIGNHLASYGYVVMSHENNTMPGVETASTTTLTNTDWFLGNLDLIAGGALQGHVDSTRITWIGHSRGGEGVVRAYDRIYDGDWVPAHYSLADIKLVSSIAPTGFLNPTSATPHAVTYHLWTGGADADVNGCASSNVAQTFQIHDRAEQRRLSISLHGVGHGDFHNGGGGSVASGPCLVGKVNTRVIMRGYLLPLVKHLIEGNIPAKDFLWRQWEGFRPIGAPTSNCVVVDLQYRDGSAGTFVLDDLQSAPETDRSSSGGAVSATVTGLMEGTPDDGNTTFTDDAGDPFNGFTYARTNDRARHMVFQYSGDSEIVFELPADQRDLSAYESLSLRAAQATRHPFTTAELGDLTFSVSLADTHGNSSTIGIGAWGGGIEEPYQRSTCGVGAGWANEYETVRIRLTDFLADGSGLDLLSVASVTLSFGPSAGSPQGRLGLDDLEFTTD